MRVLVTGGTGYLGSAIVRALERAGHDAVVFARRAARPSRPGPAIDGDIRETPAVTRAAEGCDAICHTAALVAVWRPDPAEFDAVNRDLVTYVRTLAGKPGVESDPHLKELQNKFRDTRRRAHPW